VRDIQGVIRPRNLNAGKRTFFFICKNSSAFVKAERKKKRIAEDALKAIKAKDARAFTEPLRQGGIREGPAEWKNAWKAFYSA